MKKKKINKKDNGTIILFGRKMKISDLIATVIFTAFISTFVIWRSYSNYILEYGKTEVVEAKIIDVGIRSRGGRGMKAPIGYVRFRYIVNGKEITHSTGSVYIRENIERYRIGECIEVLVSLENKNIFRWNMDSYSFRCKCETNQH